MRVHLEILIAHSFVLSNAFSPVYKYLWVNKISQALELVRLFMDIMVYGETVVCFYCHVAL